MTKTYRSVAAFIAMVALVVFSVMVTAHPARAGTLDQPSVVATVQTDQAVTVAEAPEIIQSDQFDATMLASSNLNAPKTPAVTLRDGKPRAPNLCRNTRAETSINAAGPPEAVSRK